MSVCHSTPGVGGGDPLLLPNPSFQTLCSDMAGIETLSSILQQLHFNDLNMQNHLSFLCPFARAVWNQALSWENFSVQLPQDDRTCFANWWEEAASKVPKQDRGSMESSFTLYGTCGRREIGGSSTTPIKRPSRWPP
jgi:hypothetical protein